MRICDDLRDAVLQAAMSGHLTSKYQTDEDINEYYHSLVLNKQKNVEKKKWKKENPVEEIDNSEFEYDLRDNWCWCYLGSIVCVRGGKRIPAGRTLSNTVTKQKYIRVSDMKNHSVNINDIKYVPEDLIETLSSYRISKDDLYITVAGTIGDIGEIPSDVDDANLTENADKLVFENIDKKWLMHCLLSNCVQTQIKSATTKVGQPKLAIKKIQSLSIPLPPVAEQHRIVARVDELMAKIDELEKIENQLESLKKNFPGDMKDALLQAAMQGKLTEQLPEDGDASDLLNHINLIKQELIKNKKLKKDKETEPIADDVPFEIPETWKWVRFGNIVSYRMGKTPPRKEYEWWGNDIPWVSIADMPEDGIVEKTSEFISKKAFNEKFGCNISPKGTLLMSFKLTVGRVSILGIDALHNEAIISIFPFINENNIMRDYLFKVLPFMSNYGDTKNAIKGKTLNDTSISNLLIPLPPLGEQQRIVEKLDQLLPLCECLKQ